MEKNNVSTCGPSDGTGRNVNFQTRTSGVSERKMEANRSNSRKSTGPKTVRGKNISKFNALKHGGYVKDLLLGGKHLKGYERFAKLADELQEQMAAGAYLEDKILIQMYVVAVCRLELLLEFEVRGEEVASAGAAAVLAQSYPHFPELLGQAMRGCERLYGRVQQLRQRVEEMEAAETEAEAAEGPADAAEPVPQSDTSTEPVGVRTTDADSSAARAVAAAAAGNGAGPIVRKVYPSAVTVDGANQNKVG